VVVSHVLSPSLFYCQVLDSQLAKLSAMEEALVARQVYSVMRSTALVARQVYSVMRFSALVARQVYSVMRSTARVARQVQCLEIICRVFTHTKLPTMKEP
jgi:division protein CdvB (Snf7/Vps24/ESCRT-III family)